MMIRKYFEKKGEKRTRILIPDSAHGTNPASGALCGFQVVTVPSDRDGNVDLERLEALLGGDVAGLMLTNPNTLGLFERNVVEVAERVHRCGALLYGDGANANAFLGKVRPGDLGFDVIQLNLHKTFSTPHGAGGPGSGPVGVGEALVPFLPVPRVTGKDGHFRFSEDFPDSIGRVRAFCGNFNVMVKAYAYIRSLGAAGLRRTSEIAVLNANYIKERLKPHFDLPFDRVCMHECVFPAGGRSGKGTSTRRTWPSVSWISVFTPTVYFPLIVPEAMMIEPTETESKETLDAFCDAMIAIAREAREDPGQIKSAPHGTAVGRLDEVRAARQPDVAWRRRKET